MRETPGILNKLVQMLKKGPSKEKSTRKTLNWKNFKIKFMILRNRIQDYKPK